MSTLEEWIMSPPDYLFTDPGDIRRDISELLEVVKEYVDDRVHSR